VWLLVVFGILVSVPGSAQVKKEVRFTVGQKPVISITNNYGLITVKPSGNNQVVVTMVSYADGVSFVNEQHGTRIELRAESRRAGRDLADTASWHPPHRPSSCNRSMERFTHRVCEVMLCSKERPRRQRYRTLLMPTST
jgi:hypothetical protein